MVVLVVDGVALAELGHATDAFRAAGQAPGTARPRYDVTLCARLPGSVSSREGHEVHVPAGLDAAAGADTLVLPGCAPIIASHPPDVVAAVRSAHAGGARVVATCTGVSLAIAAGLLEGRSATMHWRQEESLTSAHPEVALAPQALFVDHGDVVTGAGTTASLDLYLHLIARDHGADVAQRAGRHLPAAPRSSDQHRNHGQRRARPGAAHDTTAGRADPWRACWSTWPPTPTSVSPSPRQPPASAGANAPCAAASPTSSPPPPGAGWPANAWPRPPTCWRAPTCPSRPSPTAWV